MLKIPASFCGVPPPTTRVKSTAYFPKFRHQIYSGKSAVGIYIFWWAISPGAHDSDFTILWWHGFCMYAYFMPYGNKKNTLPTVGRVSRAIRFTLEIPPIGYMLKFRVWSVSLFLFFLLLVFVPGGAWRIYLHTACLAPMRDL